MRVDGPALAGPAPPGDAVDAPIRTSVEYLEDAVEALDITLAHSEIEHFEEPYQPLPVAGNRHPERTSTQGYV